jgi:hypothetical protein
MGKWKIVQPYAGRNYVRNPQAGGTASFAGDGGATITRSNTYAAYGESCYKVVPGGTGRGIALTCATLPASVVVLFAARDVTGALTASAGGAYGAVSPLQLLGDGWTLYVTLAALAGAANTLTIRNSKNETWYLDGIMAAAWTADLPTYLDGNQEGCAWVGPLHDSASTRPGTSRAGGLIRDFADDLYTLVTFPTGGLTGVRNVSSARPLRAGGAVDATKIAPTLLVLAAVITAGSSTSLNARQMALADLLLPDRVPLNAAGRPQPVRLQYWGAARILELAGHYDGGLDGQQEGYQMRIAPALRAADDPYWHEVITRAAALSTTVTGTIRLVIRQMSNGYWDPLGPPSAVTITPDGYIVDAIAQDSNYIYVGGVFFNLDGQAALDHLAVYDRLAGTWGALAATPANSRVHAMLLDHAGNLWIGGSFTAVNGVPCARVAMRTPAGVWTQPGTGLDGTVYALAIDAAGNIYAGGAFHNAGGVPTAHVAVLAPGGAWAQVAAGLNDEVYALAWTTYLGRLYAGGKFTDYLRYCQIDPALSWRPLQNGSPDERVYALAAIRPNAVAFGGAFTTVAGLDSDYVALYWEDGNLFIPPHGPNLPVFALAYEPGYNYLYAGGSFTELGPKAPLSARLARFRVAWPFAWEGLPVSFALDAPECLAINAGEQGGRQSPDIIFGFQGIGTATWPGQATVTLAAVAGGAESRPVFTLRRSGAGAATIIAIANLTTGKQILLNDDFVAGEELQIDLVDLHITSTYGGVLRDLTPLPGSQFASWTLLPGGNDIHVRVVADVTVTVTGTLVYRQNFHGFMAGDN